MRFPRLTISAYLAAAIILTTAPAAWAQVHELQVGGDVLDCGGRGERPCNGSDALEAKFRDQNGWGACDRGLAYDFFSAKCVNAMRRRPNIVHGDSYGRVFRQSWEGRALAFQHEVLGAHRRYGHISGITVHNAYSNLADDYAFASQYYSITEMLDAGFRVLELDVYSFTEEKWYPKVCHAPCLGTDRYFASALKEVRDWMLEPGHHNDVVFLQLEPRYTEDAIVYLDDAIAGLLDIPRIGVYSGPSQWLGGYDRPGTRTADWPTREEMRARGERVMILGQSFGKSRFIKTEKKWCCPDIARAQLQAYPICTVQHDGATLKFDPYGDKDELDELSEFWPEFAGQPTSEQLFNQVSCGVDSLKFNSLMDGVYDPNRLRAAIWSWDDDEPNVDAPYGTAARINVTDVGSPAKWTTHAPSETLPYLCQDTSALRPTYKVTNETGWWTGGFAACERAFGVDFEFATPRDGYANYRARDALLSAGQSSAWLSLQTSGGDAGWKVRSTRIVSAPDPAYVEDHVRFVMQDPPASSEVEWDLSALDGHATLDGDVYYLQDPGTFLLKARVQLEGQPPFEVSNTFTVLERSDRADGPQIELTLFTAVHGEGHPVQGYVTAGAKAHAAWRVIGIYCHADDYVPLTPPESNPRGAFFACQARGGDSPSLIVKVLAHRPDFDVDNMSKHFSIPTADTVLHSAAIANLAVEEWRPFTYTITLTDTPGEPLRVTIGWPDGIETFDATPGTLIRERTAGIRTNGRFAVPVSVSDDRQMVRTSYFDFTVGGQAPHVTITGPSSSHEGLAETFLVEAMDPGHQPIFLVGDSVNCGPAGVLEAVVLVDDNRESNKLIYSMRCRFTSGGTSNRISISFKDFEGITGMGALTLSLGRAPTGTASGPDYLDVGKVGHYHFVVKDPDLGGISLVGMSCGAGGEVMGGPAFSGFDPAAVTYTYGILCRLRSGASQTVLTGTFSDGHATTTLQKPVRAAHSITISSSGPRTYPVGSLVEVKFDAVSTLSMPQDPEGSCGSGTLNKVFHSHPAWTTSVRTVYVRCWLPVVPSIVEVSVTLTNGEAVRTSTTILTAIVPPPPPDTVAPVFTFVPPAVTLVQSTPAGTAYSPLIGTAVDTVDPNPVVTIQGVPDGSIFPVGTTTLTYLATDASGNHATATTTVTVEANTLPGEDMAVQAAPATFVLFTQVDTAGFTQSTPIDPGSAGLLPGAFVSALFAYEISTTAVVTGPITTCFTVPLETDEATFAALRILHGENGDLVDRTILAPDPAAPDFAERRLCARTESLSPFVIATIDVTPPALNVTDISVTGVNAMVPGAHVSFTPDASDDHGDVEVLCTPASASLFPFGETTVGCTVMDFAGNVTSASFTVTVLDGVAPTITVPANMTLTATSAKGAIAAFTASATDNAGSATTMCTPASGAAFAVGVTTVTCNATDQAGNTASGHFTITVNDVVTPGEMRGRGFIRVDDTKYTFDFEVRERTRGERGRLELTITEEERRDLHRRDRRRAQNDRFRARTVDFVAFSDDPRSRPGRSRKPQVDMVRFTGVGEWNGAPGYRYEVFAVDQGEPGRHREAVRITIWNPAGAVVASVDDEIDGGNVQSTRIRH